MGKTCQFFGCCVLCGFVTLVSYWFLLVCLQNPSKGVPRGSHTHGWKVAVKCISASGRTGARPVHLLLCHPGRGLRFGAAAVEWRGGSWVAWSQRGRFLLSSLAFFPELVCFFCAALGSGRLCQREQPLAAGACDDGGEPISNPSASFLLGACLHICRNRKELQPIRFLNLTLQAARSKSVCQKLCPPHLFVPAEAVPFT